MIRVQPLSIKANDINSYIVRFRRLASEHPDCGVGPYEKPDGFVEYPFEFETLDGVRAENGAPKQFYWDTHDDYTGAMWLRNAILCLDLARVEVVKTHSEDLGKPIEIIVGALSEELEQTYLVTFELHGCTIQVPFAVSGDDQQLTIRWQEGSFRAHRGNLWKLVDKANTDAEEHLLLSIAMLHAARNFIYGPDKEWEPAAP